jgi:DNA-binding response OmpR family regulator
MNPKKILIIDDEKLIVKATSLVIRLGGYQVSSAFNGEEGLKIAAEVMPDLILLDIMMPGMDGWQVLEKLKAEPVLSNIPVIIFTAKEHIKGKQKSLEAGAIDFISKPFEPDDLMQTIRNVFSRETAQTWE